MNFGGHYAQWDKPDEYKQFLYVISYVESKTYNKLVNKAQKRRTYGEKPSGYQWRERAI